MIVNIYNFFIKIAKWKAGDSDWKTSKVFIRNTIPTNVLREEAKY